MRRNKDVREHPQKLHYENLERSTRDLAPKYKKLDNLDRRIKKKSEADAPARLFFFVNDLFVGFKCTPLNFDDFENAMHRDTVQDHLQRTLDECDKSSIATKKQFHNLINYI